MKATSKMRQSVKERWTQKAHNVFGCLSEARQCSRSGSDGTSMGRVEQFLQLIWFRGRQGRAIDEGRGND